MLKSFLICTIISSATLVHTVGLACSPPPPSFSAPEYYVTAKPPLNDNANCLEQLTPASEDVTFSFRNKCEQTLTVERTDNCTNPDCSPKTIEPQQTIDFIFDNETSQAHQWSSGTLQGSLQLTVVIRTTRPNGNACEPDDSVCTQSNFNKPYKSNHLSLLILSILCLCCVQARAKRHA